MNIKQELLRIAMRYGYNEGFSECKNQIETFLDSFSQNEDCYGILCKKCMFMYENGGCYFDELFAHSTYDELICLFTTLLTEINVPQYKKINL